ncbi:MAG TPA: hypothetical protein VFB20_06080, partial [Burkholderiales bacterium]|nr:hypothetical protein [Burkholderiales bacterium]
MARPINVGVAAKIGKYSDAVLTEAGTRQLHISGTPGIGKDGTIPEAFAEQADLAWRNLIEILNTQMGSGLVFCLPAHKWGQVLSFASLERSLPAWPVRCASNSPAPSITSPPAVTGTKTSSSMT